MIVTNYTELRKDGWPYCPQCGEDELSAHGHEITMRQARGEKADARGDHRGD